MWVVGGEGGEGVMVMVMAMMMMMMVTGSRASRCVCRKVPISAWLDKLAAGGTMPAQ